MRRVPATLLIAAYLAATAYFFVLHVAGDVNRHEAGYFWTWDMYPAYETASSRRIVLARTSAGTWRRLLPDQTHRFRLHGRTGDRDVEGIPLPRGLARIDLNRSPRFLQEAVADAVARLRAADHEARGASGRVGAGDQLLIEREKVLLRAGLEGERGGGVALGAAAVEPRRHQLGKRKIRTASICGPRAPGSCCPCASCSGCRC